MHNELGRSDGLTSPLETSAGWCEGVSNASRSDSVRLVPFLSSLPLLERKSGRRHALLCITLINYYTWLFQLPASFPSPWASSDLYLGLTPWWIHQIWSDRLVFLVLRRLLLWTDPKWSLLQSDLLNPSFSSRNSLNAAWLHEGRCPSCHLLVSKKKVSRKLKATTQIKQRKSTNLNASYRRSF